jgi:hypothetical protein
MTTYFDGKKSGERTNQATLYKGFGPTAADKPILFGDRWNRNAKLVIDDVRVSRVARNPEELGFHGALKSDAHTAILDSFDNAAFAPDGKQTTKPELILAGPGGTPSPDCEFVADGKFGKALSLQKQP